MPARSYFRNPGRADLTEYKPPAIIAWMRHPESIQSISFSGHESFPLRFAWLTKAVRGVTSDPTLFGSDDAVVRLGVGKNMVRAIRHWASRADVIRPDASDRRGGRYSPTPFGDYLFAGNGVDPFLEDPATIWLVHWNLASRRQPSKTSDPSHGTEILSPTTWFYLFNELRESWFTLESATHELLDFAERHSSKQPSPGTIERDLSCFVRSYTHAEPDKRLSREDTYDSPLCELALLMREATTGRILLERSSRPTLPSLVFAYAVVDFWRRESPDSDTLSFHRMAYAPGSPGQVFKLSENACVEYMDRLGAHTHDAITYDSTAGLRQAIRHEELSDPLDLLRCSSGRRTKGVQHVT